MMHKFFKCRNNSSKQGFTLAEVLITLAIIGVIAAITLPMLISSYEAKIRETQLKKVYSILARAHQMMVVHDILPYEEFVMIDSSSNDTSGGNSGDSGDSSDGSSDSGTTEPVTPVEPDSTPEPTPEPDTGDNEDSKTTRSTSEIVDEMLDIGIWGAFNPANWETLSKDYNELLEKYGHHNWSSLVQEYTNEKNLDWFGKQTLINTLERLDSWFGGNSNKSSYRYLNIYADTAATATDDAQQSNFLTKKKYQLQVLKEQLNGAAYCTRYYLCSGEEITYTNLNGSAASIDAADFENSALRTEDGMYIWLGDINNSQRYYVDINGQKRPNRLGIDVFAFDIIPKEMVVPEMNGNCTMTGTPTDGESYRGMGCSGYALIDSNPDGNQKGYWKRYK